MRVRVSIVSCMFSNFDMVRLADVVSVISFQMKAL